MKTILLGGLIFIFLSNVLYAQIHSTTGMEVENHEEVEVLIEDLSQFALDIGLTKNRIRSRVNVRLRQVNLRPVTDRSEVLYINIHVIGSGFSIDIAFYRPVHFFSEEKFYTTFSRVYSIGNTGTHTGDSEFIISGLDRLLDQFLSDYLDAND